MIREDQRSGEQRRRVAVEGSLAGRAPHQAAQFFRGASRAELFLGFDPERAQQQVGGAVQQTHERLEHQRETELEGDDDLGHLPRDRQREVLRNQLADDHRQQGRDRDGHDRGDRQHRFLGQMDGGEQGLQEVAERRLEGEPRQQRGQGDAQLSAGEMRRRALEPADHRSEHRLAALLTRLEIGAIEVDQRELAGHEESRADGEHDPDDQEDPLGAHGALPFVRRPDGGSSMIRPSISSRRTPGLCARGDGGAKSPFQFALNCVRTEMGIADLRRAGVRASSVA